MNRIVQNICYEYYFQYYMGFYYLPQKVFDKDAVQLSNGISQANINISCFRCLIHASDMINISLDTSTNTYFFTRGDRITTAIKNFMSHPFDFDISSMVYIALNYYQNIDKNELERQISKPHGALEISDLDIKFFEESQLKYLCMPFKTGREISKSMDESYMYQLLKPFSHFGDNCFVVLITARKCSQGLETYIQRMSVKQPSWRIDIIQHEQLCKLLKANYQI